MYSVFISPSGNGLKVIVKIPNDSENHVNYFTALEHHFNSPYFDKMCKNISRVGTLFLKRLISVEFDAIYAHEKQEDSHHIFNSSSMKDYIIFAAKAEHSL